MKPKHIERIPIAQIRVLNPRSRNKTTFRRLVNNMDLVGLKKPITVFQREMDHDGTQYDLVCGEGRMNAVVALGGTDIPAVITEASLNQRYLMSLVENIARQRPPQSDLLREVRSLKEQGYKNSVVAEKLGMGRTYVDGIVRLVRCGEDRLVEQVESGRVPLSIAIQIATAGGAEVQRALSAAYDNGDLRGAKLVAVQRIIAKRSADQRVPPLGGADQTSIKDLALQYELHTQRQRALVRRAAIVHERLALLSVALKRLLTDDHLVQLLGAEGLGTMPEQLASRLA
jgi:ParB family chromosome partitioning protein